MKNLKIKIITGFRKDQSYTIDADEAHKAYYLFLNPTERGVFNNGVAIIGQDIRGIEPDYNATMGWNPAHQLDANDFNEIKSSGTDRDLRDLLQLAKTVSQNEDRSKLNIPLSELKPLLLNT